MPTELKPCPFCGGAADLVVTGEWCGRIRYYNKAYVMCRSCGAKGSVITPLIVPEAEIMHKAADDWNRRV